MSHYNLCDGPQRSSQGGEGGKPVLQNTLTHAFDSHSAFLWIGIDATRFYLENDLSDVVRTHIK